MLRTQARMICSGFANNTACMLRHKVASDPETGAFGPNYDIHTRYYGARIWLIGTVCGRKISQFPRALDPPSGRYEVPLPVGTSACEALRRETPSRTCARPIRR